LEAGAQFGAQLDLFQVEPTATPRVAQTCAQEKAECASSAAQGRDQAFRPALSS
jgi:hypothetical protein